MGLLAQSTALVVALHDDVQTLRNGSYVQELSALQEASLVPYAFRHVLTQSSENVSHWQRDGSARQSPAVVRFAQLGLQVAKLASHMHRETAAHDAPEV
jgi:hypothetical protein